MGQPRCIWLRADLCGLGTAHVEPAFLPRSRARLEAHAWSASRQFVRMPQGRHVPL